MKLTLTIIPFLALLIPTFGQMRENTSPELGCNANWKNGKQERVCEMREQKVPATQRLEVGARGAIHGDLRANAAPTLYARMGDAPALALLALALLAPLSWRPPRRSHD